MCCVMLCCVVLCRKKESLKRHLSEYKYRLCRVYLSLELNYLT